MDYSTDLLAFVLAACMTFAACATTAATEAATDISTDSTAYAALAPATTEPASVAEDSREIPAAASADAV